MAHIAAMGNFASQRGNLARTPALEVGAAVGVQRPPFHPHWRIAARLQCIETNRSPARARVALGRKRVDLCITRVAVMLVGGSRPALDALPRTRAVPILMVSELALDGAEFFCKHDGGREQWLSAGGGHITM